MVVGGVVSAGGIAVAVQYWATTKSLLGWNILWLGLTVVGLLILFYGYRLRSADSESRTSITGATTDKASTGTYSATDHLPASNPQGVDLRGIGELDYRRNAHEGPRGVRAWGVGKARIEDNQFGASRDSSNDVPSPEKNDQGDT